MRVNQYLVPSIVALCVAQASHADEKIVVVVPAILDPSAPIAEGVKNQCSVPASVGNQVFQKISERFPGTEQTQNPSQVESDRIVLKVTLLSVLGVGGGGWSGAKSITTRVDVLQNGKLITTRTLGRHSGGGFLGGVSGTCPIMDRIAVALGRDITVWLPGALTKAKQEASPSDQSTAQPPTEGGANATAPDKPASKVKQ